MHKIFSAYIRENKDCSYEKEGEILTGIFIRNGYGYIDSQMLDVFVREYKHIGYKRIDIIKRLKIMGVLEGAGGRNDVLVSVNGKKDATIRFYWQMNLKRMKNVRYIILHWKKRQKKKRRLLKQNESIQMVWRQKPNDTYNQFPYSRAYGIL